MIPFNTLCPCKSGESYENCCKKLHEGSLPKNALELMRSRYSAYALKLADYIIKTTHSRNPRFQSNKKKWAQEILLFSQNTKFENLEILEFIDGEKLAFVTFRAGLSQNDRDASFIEKSRFEKVGEQWLYLDGTY